MSTSHVTTSFRFDDIKSVYVGSRYHISSNYFAFAILKRGSGGVITEQKGNGYGHQNSETNQKTRARLEYFEWA